MMMSLAATARAGGVLAKATSGGGIDRPSCLRLRSPAGALGPRLAAPPLQARRAAVVVTAAGDGVSEDELMAKIASLQNQPKTWDVSDDLVSLGTSGGEEDAGDAEPTTSAEAIDRGLAIYRAGGYDDALTYFEMALELPGSGIVRFRGQPPTPSDGEKMASYYNIACVHARTGDVRAGLKALVGCLEAGYEDFDQLRSDPDLQGLRGELKFESLLKNYEPQFKLPEFKNPLGGLFGGKK